MQARKSHALYMKDYSVRYQPIKLLNLVIGYAKCSSILPFQSLFTVHGTQVQLRETFIMLHNDACATITYSFFLFFFVVNDDMNSRKVKRKCSLFPFREVPFHLFCCSNFDPDSQRCRWRTSSTREQELFLIVKCCFSRPFTLFSLSSLSCVG